MHKILGKAKLIDIIETCSRFSPEQMRGMRCVASRAPEEFVTDCPVVTTDDAGVAFLRNVIDQFQCIIVPEYFEKLKSTDIYVPPLPICNAVAEPVDQLIVVFDGFLEAIAFRLEATLLIAEVGKRLGKLTCEQKMSEQDFKLYALRTTLMPLHFMRSGNPLPRFVDKLSAALQQDAFVGLGWMLVFILFHELGHLALNHGTILGGSRPQLLPTLACSESINVFKHNEFSADEYAYNAILPEARGAFVVGALTALRIFSDFESMSGIGGNMHPFTINRINRLNGLAGVLDDPVIGMHTRKIFEGDFNLMQTHLAEKHPDESSLPNDLLSTFYHESFYRIIDDESQGRQAVAELLAVYLATD